jgi:septal ring factor EnvC (AmiA/AmiB activator)
MRIKGHFLLLIIALCIGTSALSQQSKRKSLEARRTQLQKDKIYINALLSNNQRKENNLLDELKDINEKIKIGEALIKVIESESKELSNEIYLNQLEINKQRRELERLKKDYGDMIFKSYKSKAQNSRIMFLLSSENFYQGYKRFQYMKQYTKFRKKQGEDIKIRTGELELLTVELQEKKDEKQSLLVVKKGEQSEIEKEKSLQNKLISQVKQKEGKYRRQIKSFQKEEERINAQIDKLIREAIASSNKASGKTAAASTSNFALTPEARELATKFASNKGKLPWPVSRGYISTFYGKQPHPVLRTATIQSNGIRITTENGSKVRAIFDGEVLAVMLMPGNKKAVLIQHGNYISNYKNLETVTVQKGDRVKTNQNIGTIFTDRITGKTILWFALYNNTKTENPTSWISKYK